MLMLFHRSLGKKFQPSLTLSPISSAESTEQQEHGLDNKIAGFNQDSKEDFGSSRESLNADIGTPDELEPMDVVDEKDEKRDMEDISRSSPLLSLPLEILHQIIEIVYYDDNTSSINSSLERFSKTIPLLLKSLNMISLRFLYKYAIFNRPHSFDMFLQNLLHTPDLGRFVEFMDFMMFSSIGLGRTGRMNQEIQMVTSSTILQALQLTPNLLELLANENIQDDIDSRVLDHLFNKLPKIQALDFCGASSESFALAFHELVIAPPPMQVDEDSQEELIPLQKLLKLSFHDCSNLSNSVFEKILPHLNSIRRLDLTHTSITSFTLREHISPDARLTHLSLAKCSKLTTRDLISFLTSSPAVALGLLRWLSLQIDSNMVSPLNENYLIFTLRQLNAPGIRYLNISGLPVTTQALRVIKQRFVNLESLSVGYASLEMSDIIEYLESNTNIKFLDISGCKKISRSYLIHILKLFYGSSLMAVEFDYRSLYEMTSGDYIKISPILGSTVNLFSNAATNQPELWKFYDNEGRRSWIYKVNPSDPEYSSSLKGYTTNTNLTLYDIETGEKIIQKTSKPAFLKYASRKINCSVGYFNLNLAKRKSYLENRYEESTWPVEFCQRGIYNYYSLNIK